ncbi:hypothetical protein FRX31_006470, partial [Thalictrum thalictroides]
MDYVRISSLNLILKENLEPLFLEVLLKIKVVGVSFLSECNILFGSTLKAVGPGNFSGAVVIPLPVG